ncbi:MAG TPA: hypothetical protein VGN47_07855 [Blastococcus sp.]|jgi:hypothetical protein|nr:hypothetical protein [Blastococcus sp.]
MLSAALLIGMGLLIAGACILGLKSSLQRRLDRATGAPDAGDRERAETLRQISREIDKGRGAGRGFY